MFSHHGGRAKVREENGISAPCGPKPGFAGGVMPAFLLDCSDRRGTRTHCSTTIADPNTGTTVYQPFLELHSFILNLSLPLAAAKNRGPAFSIQQSAVSIQQSAFSSQQSGFRVAFTSTFGVERWTFDVRMGYGQNSLSPGAERHALFGYASTNRAISATRLSVSRPNFRRIPSSLPQGMISRGQPLVSIRKAC